MDDTIKVVESLEKSGLLIDGATETVKHEIEKQNGGFLDAMMVRMAASLIAPIASSLIQPLASSLINAISGKEVMRAEKGEEGGIPSFLVPGKVPGKGLRRAGRGYNNMDKNF